MNDKSLTQVQINALYKVDKIMDEAFNCPNTVCSSCPLFMIDCPAQVVHQILFQKGIIDK